MPSHKTGKNACQFWNILNVPVVVADRSRHKETEISKKPSVDSVTKLTNLELKGTLRYIVKSRGREGVREQG